MMSHRLIKFLIPDLSPYQDQGVRSSGCGWPAELDAG